MTSNAKGEMKNCEKDFTLRILFNLNSSFFVSRCKMTFFIEGIIFKKKSYYL